MLYYSDFQPGCLEKVPGVPPNITTHRSFTLFNHLVVSTLVNKGASQKRLGNTALFFNSLAVYLYFICFIFDMKTLFFQLQTLQAHAK